MGRAMGPAEITEFLTTGTRAAKVATVRDDGRPHVAPVWFVLDGDDIVFTTDASSVKGRNLARDPVAAVIVDLDAPPFGFVLMEGEVDLTEDPEAIAEWSGRIRERYLGPDAGPGHHPDAQFLVRFHPRTTVSRYGIVPSAPR